MILEDGDSTHSNWEAELQECEEVVEVPCGYYSHKVDVNEEKYMCSEPKIACCNGWNGDKKREIWKQKYKKCTVVQGSNFDWAQRCITLQSMAENMDNVDSDKWCDRMIDDVSRWGIREWRDVEELGVWVWLVRNCQFQEATFMNCANQGFICHKTNQLTNDMETINLKNDPMVIILILV